jgi:ABC-2 type transport system ATP-binding protein
MRLTRSERNRSVLKALDGLWLAACRFLVAPRARIAEALLLDEPTSGLDPKASNTFSESIAEMSTKGVAILMATHDLFRAKESGTRIGIMRDGVLREILRCSEISHSELEQLYLHHMN